MRVGYLLRDSVLSFSHTAAAALQIGINFSSREGGLRRFLFCFPSEVREVGVLAARSLPRRSVRCVAQHRTFTAGIFPKRMQIMGRKSGFRECRPPPRRPRGSEERVQEGKTKRGWPEMGGDRVVKKSARVRTAATKVCHTFDFCGPRPPGPFPMGRDNPLPPVDS